MLDERSPIFVIKIIGMKYRFSILVAIVLTIGIFAVGCKERNSYMVTFNPNGGVGTMSSQEFVEGEEKALSANLFVRENFSFSGWNTIADGSGTAYSDGQKVMLVADVTLYAQWIHNKPQGNDTTINQDADTVCVVFDANGGVGEMEPQLFVVGVAQALSANAFTRENHSFVFWNTIPDGSGRTYSDTQQITISENTTLYAQWMALSGDSHSFVDLGLPSGILWATCNVGAANPEDYGYYFAWAETMEKGAYTWESYRYAEGTTWNYPRLTKYCSDPLFGDNSFSDNLFVIEASDDAATANWGSDWRMPTSTEMQELFDNCTHSWTTQNGINGLLFVGSNDNSIFLPAAGYRSGCDLSYDGSYGIYWTSSLYEDVPSRAWGLFFGSDSNETRQTYRNCGLTIRAVKSRQ